MQVKSLHSWVRDPREAVRIQTELAGRISLRAEPGADYRVVAGADVSSVLYGHTLWAAVVVLRLPEFEVLEEAFAVGRADFPYVPGLLSFREIPVLLEAFRRLRTVPQVVVCDGQGIAHPRFLGLASHLGLWLDLPTVGCAKSRLVGQGPEPGPDPGDWVPLDFAGRTVAVALRTRPRSRPLYVSPGHRMDLEGAVRLVLASRRSARLPEPTRLAHLAVNNYRRRQDSGPAL
ncbi:MAG: endonuclease V [Candidatus Zixiibacteriota bacterium]|nr:MAG: endonuclease V [candidate division Zixibacteria bacterium]